jgi:hypothetical protein
MSSFTLPGILKTKDRRRFLKNAGNRLQDYTVSFWRLEIRESTYAMVTICKINISPRRWRQNVDPDYTVSSWIRRQKSSLWKNGNHLSHNMTSWIWKQKLLPTRCWSPRNFTWYQNPGVHNPRGISFTWSGTALHFSPLLHNNAGYVRVCVCDYRLSRAVMQVTAAAGKVRDGTLPHLAGWTFNRTVCNSLTQFHIVALCTSSTLADNKW